MFAFHNPLLFVCLPPAHRLLHREGELNQTYPRNNDQTPTNVKLSQEKVFRSIIQQQLANQSRFLPSAPATETQIKEEKAPFSYRQLVAVTVVHSPYDPRPPRPPGEVPQLRRLVPADTEEPLPDQLRPSLDCHGPTLADPPVKNFPTTTPLQTWYWRH